MAQPLHQGVWLRSKQGKLIRWHARRRRSTLWSRARQPRRQMFGFPFEQRKHCARTCDHRAWQPCKLSHLDSVGAICASRLQLMEKQYPIAHFAHAHIIVTNCY